MAAVALFAIIFLLTIYGWGAVLLMAYLMKSIPGVGQWSLRWRFVIGHTFLVLAVMAFSLIIPLNRTEIIGGDYWPFFLYPGALMYSLSLLGMEFLFQVLIHSMDRFTKTGIVIIYLPGSISIFIGSVIWYGVGLKSEKWVKRWNEEDECDLLPTAILIDDLLAEARDSDISIIENDAEEEIR